MNGGFEKWHFVKWKHKMENKNENLQNDQFFKNICIQNSDLYTPYLIQAYCWKMRHNVSIMT